MRDDDYQPFIYSEFQKLHVFDISGEFRKCLSYNPLTGEFSKLNNEVYFNVMGDKQTARITYRGYGMMINKAKLAVHLYLGWPKDEFSVTQLNRRISTDARFAWNNLKIHVKNPALVDEATPSNVFKDGKRCTPIKKVKKIDNSIPDPNLDGVEGSIYMFQNILNGKVYIGQSIDVAGRYENHINTAVKHAKTEFHQAVRWHGEKSFAFRVIKDCPASQLNYWERHYIREYDSYENGYNSTRGNK